MGIVGVSYWDKLKAQNHLDLIVITCLKGNKELQAESISRSRQALGIPKMLPPTDAVNPLLPGENAATGELVAEEQNLPKYPMDMASMTAQKRGPLCMRIRLGSNPRSEFVNGVPPGPALPSTLHPVINAD